MALASCSDEVAPNGGGEATPLTGIIATMGDATQSRATLSLSDPDYIGRLTFADGDDIVFTYMARTHNPITNFVYSGINWHRADNSWNRVMADGSPERIYWSDSQNPHTFIAYSLPQQPGGESFDWTYDPGTKIYTGTIGTPDNTTDSVSFASRYTGGKILPADSGAIKLRREDIVLHHSTDMQAQPGGSVALVQFRHALSYVQVVLNINGFSASSESADNNVHVWDVTLMNQPIHYQWDQQSDGAKPVPGNTATKHLKACTFNPEGRDAKQYRQFVYNSLAVPTGDDGRTLSVKFKVTYPDPLNPDSKTITRTYMATKENVKFYAGQRTTVNISLNHKDEGITVGAEYGDWESVQTIDSGNLTKKSTFLDTTSRDSVTIHTDAAATSTDATWLYYKRSNNGEIEKDENGKDIVLDIYGHTGKSREDAYVISTARQMLSMAYEVKNGYTFGGVDNDDYRYVRLDANLNLQPKLYVDLEQAKNEAGKLLKWVGIGDDKHKFQGCFMGGKRTIGNLYGSPLFAYTDSKSVVERLILNHVIEVQGNGAVSETNHGVLAAIVIKGDVTGTKEATPSGSVVGTNEAGIVISCVHNGKVEGPGLMAGIVGANTDNGHIIASYHTGKVIATGTNPQVGGIVAQSDHNLVYGAYYNKDFLTPTIDYHSGAMTSTQMLKESFVTTLNGHIDAFCEKYVGQTDKIPEEVLNYLRTLKFIYTPAYYPEPK